VDHRASDGRAGRPDLSTSSTAAFDDTHAPRRSDRGKSDLGLANATQFRVRRTERPASRHAARGKRYTVTTARRSTVRVGA